jgi:hypothetical protein
MLKNEGSKGKIKVFTTSIEYCIVREHDDDYFIVETYNLFVRDALLCIKLEWNIEVFVFNNIIT